MHILLIHQAFAAIDEPGGTRHHEIAQYLVEQGHQVTIIASPVSYLTGKSEPAAEKKEEWNLDEIREVTSTIFPVEEKLKEDLLGFTKENHKL